MIWPLGHGVRMCVAAPGGNSWWRASPVSVHRHRQGVCAHVGQRGAQGEELTVDIFPFRSRGTLCRHGRISGPGATKRRATQVSLASLASTHRLECAFKAWLVREDNAEICRRQDRRGHRQRSRQDFSRSRGFRRQKKTTAGQHAPRACWPVPDCGLLSGHELRCRFSSLGRRACSGCSEGCILPSGADNGQVPREPFILRWSSASEASHVSVPSSIAAPLSRCPPPFSRQANHTGALLDKVGSHHLHPAPELFFCHPCLGPYRLRWPAGTCSYRSRHREVAKIKASARGHRRHPRHVKHAGWRTSCWRRNRKSCSVA
mmetsp:Transcript_6308/g.14381  ORF Transcript_6308/g.14381 Transcript_6308/m.14381 type:complete len:318 (-) Transcript_6308:1852-2805(-)